MARRSRGRGKARTNAADADSHGNENTRPTPHNQQHPNAAPKIVAFQPSQLKPQVKNPYLAGDVVSTNLFPGTAKPFAAQQARTPKEKAAIDEAILSHKKKLCRWDQMHSPAEAEILVPELDRLFFDKGEAVFRARPRPWKGEFAPEVGLTYRQFRLRIREEGRPMYIRMKEKPTFHSKEDWEAYYRSTARFRTPRFRLSSCKGSSVPPTLQRDFQTESGIVTGLQNQVLRDAILQYLPRHADRTRLAACCQMLDALVNRARSIATIDLNYQPELNDQRDDQERLDDQGVLEGSTRKYIVVEKAHGYLARNIEARRLKPEDNYSFEKASVQPFAQLLTSLSMASNVVQILHLHKVDLLNINTFSIFIKSMPKLSHIGIYDCDLITITDVPMLLDILDRELRPDGEKGGVLPVEPITADHWKSLVRQIQLDVRPKYWVGPQTPFRMGSYGLFWDSPDPDTFTHAAMVRGIAATYLRCVSLAFPLGIDLTEPGCGFRNWLESLPLGCGKGIHLVNLACHFTQLIRDGAKMSSAAMDNETHSLVNHAGYVVDNYQLGAFQFEPYLAAARPLTKSQETCPQCQITYPHWLFELMSSECAACRLKTMIRISEDQHHLLAKKREAAQDILRCVDPDWWAQVAKVVGAETGRLDEVASLWDTYLPYDLGHVALAARWHVLHGAFTRRLHEAAGELPHIDDSMRIKIVGTLANLFKTTSFKSGETVQGLHDVDMAKVEQRVLATMTKPKTVPPSLRVDAAVEKLWVDHRAEEERRGLKPVSTRVPYNQLVMPRQRERPHFAKEEVWERGKLCVHWEDTFKKGRDLVKSWEDIEKDSAELDLNERNWSR